MASANVIYIDPTGFDGNDCAQTAPCKTLTFAYKKATGARNKIVMAVGQYVERPNLDVAMTGATTLEIYGNGAAIAQTMFSELPLFQIGQGFQRVMIDNVALSHMEGTGLLTGSPVTLTSSTVMGGSQCISAAAGLNLSDVSCLGAGNVSVSGQLTADRITIRGPMAVGLLVQQGTALNVTNMVVTGATSQCVQLLTSSSGTIAFSTIADCGTSLASGPSAIQCSGSNAVIQSSIIWAPGPYAEIDPCSFSRMIIGPNAVAGASSTDPQFVSLATHDLHLMSSSPAIDTVDMGPMFDVERTSRPQGARFDYGAYEHKP